MFEKVDSNIEISGVMFIKVMRGFDISVGCFMNVDGIFMNVDGDFWISNRKATTRVAF